MQSREASRSAQHREGGSPALKSEPSPLISLATEWSGCKGACGSPPVEGGVDLEHVKALIETLGEVEGSGRPGM